MRAAHTILLASVLLAGCGGGGGVSSAISGDNTAMYPTVTTTYSGTLKSPTGITEGTVTLTTNPDHSFTMSSDVAPEFNVSGTFTNPGAAPSWTMYFTYTPTSTGEWLHQGQTVTGGVTYTGSGNITFGTTDISGSFGILNPGVLSYTGATVNASKT